MPRGKKKAVEAPKVEAPAAVPYQLDSDRLFTEWKKIPQGPSFAKRARAVYAAVLGREGLEALVDAGFAQAMNLWETRPAE